jgi:sec-independent protein translocase protein TatB
VSFHELSVVFVVALLVLGPERLPDTARQIVRWVGRARRAASQLRYEIERELTSTQGESRDDVKKGDSRDRSHR